MRTTALFIALVVAAVATSVSAQPRHSGVFAYTGAECSSEYTTTQAVQAYAEPRAASRALRTVEAQRRIDANDYTEDLFVVTRPGIAVARRDVSLVDWGYHNSSRRTSGPLRIPRGTRVELLGGGFEAYGIFRFGGTTYSGLGVPTMEWMAEDSDPRDFTVESWPTVEHWVRLSARSGRPAAWLNASQPGVRFRRFVGGMCD